MNFWFVITLILAAVAAIAGMTGAVAKEPKYRDDIDIRPAARRTALAVAVLTLLALGLSSATIVSTKSVGIVTSFGRPTGTLSNGFHLTAPWAKVTEFDAAIQTDSHVGADGNKDDGNCVTVRLASSSTACVDHSVRWRIRQTSADALFRDYKDFDRVRESLVTRELNASLNEVFSTFDPLAAIGNTTADKPAYSLDVMAGQVTEKLRAKVGTQIEVLNVIIPLVRFDAPTEERIKAYQAAQADTRIAKQKQETAAAEAKANESLAGSVGTTNVLVSKCLDWLERMRADKQPIPAGFTCWPGNSVPVIAQTK